MCCSVDFGIKRNFALTSSLSNLVMRAPQAMADDAMALDCCRCQERGQWTSALNPMGQSTISFHKGSGPPLGVSVPAAEDKPQIPCWVQCMGISSKPDWFLCLPDGSPQGESCRVSPCMVSPYRVSPCRVSLCRVSLCRVSPAG